MRSAPRKLSTESELYTTAINGLARRAYSVHEMRTYLERRAEDKDVVKNVLDRLKHLDYLDDARYARQFVRLHTELRKQGAFRIARDLRARGVPDRHIEAALAERAPESSESTLVRERLQRRIKTLRGPLDERRVASLYRSLLRAGFSADTIRRELSALAKQPVEEIPESSGEEA
jgi:regulatory protein